MRRDQDAGGPVRETKARSAAMQSPGARGGLILLIGIVLAVAAVPPLGLNLAALSAAPAALAAAGKLVAARPAGSPGVTPGICAHYADLHSAVQGLESSNPQTALSMIDSTQICEGDGRRVLLSRLKADVLVRLGQDQAAIEVLWSVGDLPAVLQLATTALAQTQWAHLKLYLTSFEPHHSAVDAVSAYEVGWLYYNLAKNYEANKDSAQALDLYATAASWHPSIRVDAGIARAQLLARLRRLPAAVSVTTAALGATSDSWGRFRLLRQLGTLWEVLGQQPYAYCSYQAATELYGALPANTAPQEQQTDMARRLQRVVEKLAGAKPDCVKLLPQWQPSG